MLSLPFYVVFGVIIAVGCALGMLAEMKIEEAASSDYVATVVFSAMDAAAYTLVLAIVQFVLEM